LTANPKWRSGKRGRAREKPREKEKNSGAKTAVNKQIIFLLYIDFRRIQRAVITDLFSS
jgi:hypothetical protein